jgi:sensor histidine kinase YesM
MYNNARQMSNTVESAMNWCVYTLENEMQDVTLFEQKLCYSDNSFQLLTMKNLPDSQKVMLQYNVTEMLNRQVSPYECIFVFNKDYSRSMTAYGSSFTHNGPTYVYRVKEDIRNYWFQADKEKFNTWITFQSGDHTILMKAFKVRELYVCTTIDLDNFSLTNNRNSDDNELIYGFFDDKQILSNKEYFLNNKISIDDIKKDWNGIQFFSKNYIKTSPIQGTDIQLCYIYGSNDMWRLAQITVLAFIGIAIVICLVIIYIFYFLKSIMLYPLEQINATTTHLEQNNASLFLANSDSNIIEYQNINHALANLIDQKIALSTERERESYEKDHAKLQYYYLQTRSHFFVNCLKSLYNMLENKEYEKMQLMIIAFSNHLRYVFHDNLKLVSLESELLEVNDYFKIILLDRVSPLILNQQIDESLNKYQVPSLLIQTFLENTAKYNKQSDQLLIFDIKITAATLNDVPVMQIHLSDNGVGYTPELLEQLNSGKNDIYAKEHVGISNLKHRIALIYKANYQFAFYNNPTGGACALIYLPLLDAPEK